MTKKNTSSLFSSPQFYEDYFQEQNGLFIRYVAGFHNRRPGPGTVIYLSDWGDVTNYYHNILLPLHQRGFHVISYEWYQHRQKKQERPQLQNFHFCFNSHTLDIFFRNIVLPDFPAPFYLVAHRAGGSFALSSSPVLQNKIRRILILSPCFTANNHKANSLYHQLIRLQNFIVPKKKFISKYSETSTPDKNEKRIAWQYMILNATSLLFSPQYPARITIPTLFIVPDRDETVNLQFIKEYTYRVRLAEMVQIHATPATIFDHSLSYHQFWHSFDCFIPGSSPPSEMQLLEPEIGANILSL